MTNLDEKLYQYMMENNENMTKDWFNQVFTSGAGEYAQPKHSPTFQKLGEMNGIYNRAITDSILGKEAKLQDWAEQIAASRTNTATPLHDVITNFSIFRSIYYSYLEKFIDANDVPGSKVIDWIRLVSRNFDKAVQLVTKKYIDDYENIFSAQQETIIALGTPVIKVDEGLGIIPLVGEIDTYRAGKMMESALYRASELELEYIILDLSGVPIIDTMVANQVYQLGESFSLLGITMIITGMRPEIAQTSISLGLDFSKMQTFAHLYQAIRHIRNL